jgi:L-asparaginase
MSNPSVKILVTGGTFDKEYDELNGKLFFKDSHLTELLKLGRCNLQVNVRTLMMIDSLEMNDSDRALILNTCEKSEERQIVITHGTDTMEITAKLLGKAQLDKTIVLTGAMIPYKFGSSDGLFNLGTALGLCPVFTYRSLCGYERTIFQVEQRAQKQKQRHL